MIDRRLERFPKPQRTCSNISSIYGDNNLAIYEAAELRLSSIFEIRGLVKRYVPLAW